MCDDHSDPHQSPEERRHLEQLLVGVAALRASMFTVATALVLSALAIVVALIQQPLSALTNVILISVGLLLCLLALVAHLNDRRVIKAGLDSGSIQRRLNSQAVEE